MEFSEEMGKYFENIRKKTEDCHAIAAKARQKNLDPDDEVEISLAKNMAERVVGLISSVAPQIKDSNLVPRIQELEKEYGVLDWRVAFKIAEEIAKQEICKFDSEREAMEIGIKAGFAYVTVGVVSACLEGFTRLEIKERRDKKKYFCMNFSGPIRNAGGTAAAVSVLIGDYVRKKMGYAEYDPNEDEINRYFSEVEHYNDRCVRIQYMPSKEEVDFVAKHMPLEIGGDPTEKIEVPNYKNLPRVPTNLIRSGMCLIMSSCIPLKGPKLWSQLSKWGKEFDMEQWNFLEKFIKVQKDVRAKLETRKKDGNKNEEKPKLLPDHAYISDLVGGRPVLAHPLAKGGFRLRYGRSRTSGDSAQCIHPATMHVLNDFIAVGTHMKVERPSKGAIYTPCDAIEGPIIKLENGNVMRIDSAKEAKQYKKEIKEILFLGDILICYGDFFDRAHKLVPPGYCEEWWILELEKAIVDTFGSFDMDKAAELCNIKKEFLLQLLEKPLYTKPSPGQALSISYNLNIPLHPRYTYHWEDISLEQLDLLQEWLKKADVKIGEDIEKIVVPKVAQPKRVLELLGVPHIVATEFIVIEKEDALPFFTQMADFDFEKLKASQGKTPLEILNDCAKIKIRDKSGIYIGTRMGRPEKGKMRKLKGSPHGLFPIGEEGGRMRSFHTALESGKVTSSFPIFRCESCNKITIYPSCEDCGKITKKLQFCKVCGYVEKCQHEHLMPYNNREIEIKHYFDNALKILGTTLFPDTIKGIKGTVNEEHRLEHLAKAILRAKYDLYVNKDGTIRYDATEIPITHFKPKEISVTIKKLKELGYEKDINNKPIERDDQVIELKPQDIVLPCCPEIEYPADEVFLKVTKFIDELLVKLYKQPAYYNCKTRDDLVGKLMIGLAPHTSAGMVVRILGFSKNQGLMAHPLIHSAMRRDCDGDEAGIFMLMDGLLNFSRKYLPGTRGSTMDAPLVLTSVLTASEVDDMVFKMDTVWKYPLEFYNACLEWKNPWDVKIQKVLERLGTPAQYEGYGFTHDTDDFNTGVLISSYKTLPAMQEKLLVQMDIAEKIRAVDEADVAALVINKHFVKDTKGNLRKFSQQLFRCVACNSKYRRPPLIGKCINPKCKNGRLIFTISEGSVVKYLEPSLSIAERYNVSPYIKQTLELTKVRIESVFGKDKEKQEGLGKWFS
ncbi:DNA polymerase II large subunit [Candidatus Woesearchaeota archaeon]|nr:DNA polymerase II large subunit [Candidatus Woesearchaeota archaeon]